MILVILCTNVVLCCYCSQSLTKITSTSKLVRIDTLSLTKLSEVDLSTG